METLNDKFCKVTGLTWDLNQYIASLKNNGMTDEQISEKILWFIPDGAMLDDPKYRKAVLTKELLSDEALTELGIDEDAKFGPDEESEEDEHEYVDLGLPSGTLWATENIKDADGNELYFAWGETSGYTAEQVGTGEGKRAFTWNDYEFDAVDWSDTTNYGMTKYNSVDEKIELDSEDDAATANWGEEWRMPTKEQFDELIANTTTAATQVDGVNGILFTSTANNNTLFFPAVGYASEGRVNDVGRRSDCWSVSLDCGSVYRAYKLADFVYGNCIVSYEGRLVGCSVRPVRVK